MKIFERVFKSVLRRRTSTLIILMFSFLLGNSMFVSLSIEQSSENIKNKLYEEIGSKIILYGNVTNKSNINDDYTYENNKEYEKSMNNLLETYNTLRKKSYVAYGDVNYYMRYIYLTEGYQLERSVDERIDSIFRGIGEADLVDIKENKIILINGESFTNEQIENGENVLLVNDKVTYNGKPVQVGDEITFELIVEARNEKYKPEIVCKEKISYRVIGIFQVLNNKYSDLKEELPPFYVPNENLVQLAHRHQELASNYERAISSRIWVDTVLIRAKSLTDLTRLEEDFYIASKDKDIDFESTSNVVYYLCEPLDMFASIARFVKVITIGAMILIIGFISFYFIRDRKKEFGIYLSLGMKKISLIAQVILEVVCVGLLGAVLSISSGYYLSKTYSNYLINTLVHTKNDEMEKYVIDYENLNPNGITKLDMMENYDIVITINEIIELVGYEIITLTISSLFPLIYILRLKPKNILLE